MKAQKRVGEMARCTGGKYKKGRLGECSRGSLLLVL